MLSYLVPDDNYSPNGRDVIPIDVPVTQETLYDNDDMHGVVNDTDMGFEPMYHTIIDILGGKCVVCGIRDMILLRINSIRAFEDDESQKFVRHLVEETIRNGKDPRKDFCVLCYNHEILMNKIKKYRKSLGLEELTRDELDQELRIETH